jgi:DNA-binding GntR family transcriptional regulator
MAKTVKSSLYEDLKRRILTMELDPDRISTRSP